jgi:hypothetical protein
LPTIVIGKRGKRVLRADVEDLIRRLAAESLAREEVEVGAS